MLYLLVTEKAYSVPAGVLLVAAELVQLILLAGHQDLANVLVWDAMRLAVIIQALLAFHTEPGLQAAWGIVDACRARVAKTAND